VSQRQSRDPRENEPYEIDWLEYFKDSLGRVNVETVYPHVFNNADREVGGVLVGMKAVRGDLPLIDGAIGAMSADEQRANLTFTQESWEHVHRVMEVDFPKSQIVGWYHSHPGFGIFLSEDDLFIHHNFFSDRSQVALVVDPIAGTEGVFGWSGEQVIVRYEQETPVGWGPLDLKTIASYDPDSQVEAEFDHERLRMEHQRTERQ
jgi:proteasome lid subunit RPN8/RPN11